MPNKASTNSSSISQDNPVPGINYPTSPNTLPTIESTTKITAEFSNSPRILQQHQYVVLGSTNSVRLVHF